ncbi:acyl carrier protein [Serratia sp. UGAL515B_01]|uniref:acyl carrier protein n=1 Tax=Serratia sp. UGAL515B_01 TaxID=2986763 RepID=UPI0029553741|nr:acyl carrier protein [Serratia sp. UGAL515B_01]WON77978.1 acyl carrier protein [Serratia sp. UGAL515B_01]
MEKYEKIYNAVCDMICDAKDLDKSELSPEASLHELKLESLDYIELVVMVKREFGITLGPELFTDNLEITIEEFCQNLVKQLK